MAQSLGTAVLQLTVGDTGLVGGLAAAQAKTRSAMASMAATGTMLTKRLTLPIAAAGVASGKLAMDFETSMGKIISLVGVSRDQVDEWSDQILRLGPEVGKSPRELADAMFFITSAGLRGKDALDTLEASAKASAAGLGETKVVADAVTSAMNAYGAEVLPASAATDILTAAVREGKLEADQLAPAIGKVIPLASAMGVPFNDVAAALASMSRTGTDAATASTQVRAILAGLVKPSVDSAKAMGELGTSAEEVRKSIREKGLLETLQDLKDRAGGNDEMMARLFPNIRALSGVMDMLGASSETTEAIFGELSDATGVTEQAFAEAGETTQQKLNQALSALHGAGILIGQVVLPVFARIAVGVTKIAAAFADLPGPVRAAILAFVGLLAAVGPLMVMISAIVSPIGLVIAALVGLGLGLYYAWNRSETFRSIVQAVFDWLVANVPPAVEAVRTAIQVAFAWVMANIPPILTAVAQAAADAWEWIRSTFAPVAAFLITTWKQVSSAIRTNWGDIRATIVTVAGFLRQFIGTWLSGIRAIWGNVWAQIKVVVEQAWDVIRTIISSVLPVIGNAIRLFLAVLRGDWGEAWNALKALVGSVLSAVRAIVTAALKALVTIAGNLALNVAKAIWNGVKTVGGLLGQLAGVLGRAIRDAISSAAASAFSWAADIGRRIVDGVLSGLGGLASAVRDRVSGALSSALSGLNPFSPVEHGGEMYIGEPIVSGAVEGITENADSIRRALNLELAAIVPHVDVPDVADGTRRDTQTGGRPAAGAVSPFAKLADTVNFWDRPDSAAILADLGNRLALRTGGPT